MTTLTINVKCLTVFHEQVRIAGVSPALGEWNVQRAPLLQWAGNYWWTVTIQNVSSTLPLEFKFVVTRDDDADARRYLTICRS